jgi:bifunctional DNase/RNase
VTELRDGTFYARLELDLHGRALRIDARPSDAIAVALRAGVPVLVAESLLALPLDIPADENALDIDLPRAPRLSPESPRL